MNKNDKNYNIAIVIEEQNPNAKELKEKLKEKADFLYSDIQLIEYLKDNNPTHIFYEDVKNNPNNPEQSSKNLLGIKALQELGLRVTDTNSAENLIRKTKPVNLAELAIKLENTSVYMVSDTASYQAKKKLYDTWEQKQLIKGSITDDKLYDKVIELTKDK
jgi:hypothetical protein